MSAGNKERERLLLGMHDRFWHAPPQDMLRLLQACCLPREIVLQGVDVARKCEHCRKYQRLPRLTLRFGSALSARIIHRREVKVDPLFTHLTSGVIDKFHKER